MSAPDALPQRAPGAAAQISEAALADGGFDGFLPIEWLKGTGISMSNVAYDWATGQLAEIPIGKVWDVVRVPRTEGWEVVRQLRVMCAPIGPVLHTEDAVEFLVPVGSADDWDLPDSSVLQVGAILHAPHPAVVAPHTRNAKSWIVAPRAENVLTDAADLYGAYVAARARILPRSGRAHR
ncbi:hypothetical protein ACIQPP_05690 [Streptomyces violaceusniger]|uniref:hypothetical protein n=1 Tax=Streptomyces violaceusniger TaxID=68280 RepID=UPI0009C1FF3A|nr:hypothetical protein [Streptomyces hygroscopicus]AQW55312.1 hypothetical protein SHXM_08775 [Streptomyces hygroscopicus]